MPSNPNLMRTQGSEGEGLNPRGKASDVDSRCEANHKAVTRSNGIRIIALTILLVNTFFIYPEN